MRGVILLVIFLALLSDIALAATIHGEVYSFDLEKQNNAVVSINSVPKQTVVAKDGSYSFDVNPGEYSIEAKYSELGELKGYTLEQVNIAKEGSYILDLILFPDLNESEELMQQIEEQDLPYQTDYFIYIISGVAVVLIILIVFLIFKYRKITEKLHKQDISGTSDLAQEVFNFIKSNGGRTTQKDIRAKFPSSEAKISLVITELQHKGVIERIKKGRGNIIIIKKN